MIPLIVVEHPKRWPVHIPGAELVAAKEYLSNPRFLERKRIKVFNFCQSYGYQSVGYYVSLLAAARGHRPIPSVAALQDLSQRHMVRMVSHEIGQIVEQTLAPLKSDRFELSVYFGFNLSARYDRLSRALFSQFPVPLMRAEFVREKRWKLTKLRPIASKDIPETHQAFVIAQALKFFSRPRVSSSRRPRYDLAILVNPDEHNAPSDPVALTRFVRAATKIGMAPTLITKNDFHRVGFFDALFIRETTAVNHHTYRFARRAEAEGLFVIDDSKSIIACTNKVYQAELFRKAGIPCPKTIVVHKDNAREIGARLGFPCVLKQPDSSFSVGVVRARDEREVSKHLASLFHTSDLVVAQQFVESSFDWRVGVLDGIPLYVCKYHMAKGHWQIMHNGVEEADKYGAVETLSVAKAPPHIVQLGVKVAQKIGQGLYGIDIKETAQGCLVIEVNDNPSIDAGFEDAVLKDQLYLNIMQHFYDVLERRAHA